MVVQGPPQQLTATAMTATFDLVGHGFTIVYTPPNGIPKTITGAIPAGVLTQIETAVQRQIESDQGWTNGSSTVVTP